MNAKQIVPVIARVAPPILLIVLAGLAIKSLFSGNAAENQPESTTANGIPQNSPEIPPLSAAMPKVTVADSQPPVKRRLVTREDLANVFRQGWLTRPEAVAALKRLGFSKSAAYEALSEEGRFAFLLHFAPDGLIAWRG